MRGTPSAAYEEGGGAVKAVVYKGPFSVAVEDVPDPRIEAPNDTIVRIIITTTTTTTSSSCGSDVTAA